MPPENGESRTQHLPRTGTKICWLVGAVLLVIAIYLAFVPLRVSSNTGPPLGCGSALSPNDGAFKGFCTDLDKEALYRAIAALVAAVAVVGLGSVLFGFDQRTRTRVARADDDDDDDEVEDRHEQRARRTSARAARTDSSRADSSRAASAGTDTPLGARGQSDRSERDARDEDETRGGQARPRTTAARVRGGASSSSGRRPSAGGDLPESAPPSSAEDRAERDAAGDREDDDESRGGLRKFAAKAQRRSPREDVDNDYDEYDEYDDEYDAPGSRR